ncbi:MAG: imidazole glycerol phosphate synthase subunit HisF [Treponema sp.]|nr:imidazole glycerol phosphate synthase subunit HisF [Treponema sp.]
MNDGFKRIIPCLDIKDCRVVKGVQFEGLSDAGDPISLARRYQSEGADCLASLDIGSSDRRAFVKLISEIASGLSIPFCVGGGIKTLDDMKELMDAGVTMVSVSSAALARPELLSEMAGAYGNKAVVLAIDARRVPGPEPRWEAYANGGRVNSGLDVITWAKRGCELGAGEIMLNSIDADGTKGGYDLELCQAVAGAVPVPVIASGGAGSLEQIEQVLSQTAVEAALVASILHYGNTSVLEIKEYLKERGIKVYGSSIN